MARLKRFARLWAGHSGEWPDPRLTSLGALALAPRVGEEEEALEISIWGDFFAGSERR